MYSCTFKLVALLVTVDGTRTVCLMLGCIGYREWKNVQKRQ